MPTRNTPEKKCPLSTTCDMIDGKWKGGIVLELLGGTKRFGELKRLLNGITQRVLTQQLRELEDAGIVSRKVYAEVPPKVEYSLTALGKTLHPILELKIAWGKNYLKLRKKTRPE